MKGKAIYQPTGRALEYAKWACNFYTGCSNNCDYCYCKRGVMAHTWSTTPKLKACFKDEYDAIKVFEKELIANLKELEEHGLFFSFTTDPMLPETSRLTMEAINICFRKNVPVVILTKNAHFFYYNHFTDCLPPMISHHRKYFAIGFTLTGHDDLETGASPTAFRIEEMKRLHDIGFKTWASIEPIIDLKSSAEMIKQTMGFCDLYKIGLLSNKKYDWKELREFLIYCIPIKSRFYFKDSFLQQAVISRNDLSKNCVTRDYNLFK